MLIVMILYLFLSGSAYYFLKKEFSNDFKNKWQFAILSSVADPDPHGSGSAFKKSSRIRIRMERCGSGPRR